MSRRATSGQSTMEYAMCIAAIAAALISMTLYIRRAIQANLKMVEKHINAEALR